MKYPENEQPASFKPDGLLLAFEQVVSRFEANRTIGPGNPFNSNIESEREPSGNCYFDLEKAFAVAFPLNLESVPNLKY
jgi:hypothetical protein